jgi:hypothetical protein
MHGGALASRIRAAWFFSGGGRAMDFCEKVGTIVLNIMDGRERFFALPPDKAVIAAFEIFDTGEDVSDGLLNPPTHPNFNEHRLGYSCGDWIAYKDSCMLK